MTVRTMNILLNLNVIRTIHISPRRQRLFIRETRICFLADRNCIGDSAVQSFALHTTLIPLKVSQLVPLHAVLYITELQIALLLGTPFFGVVSKVLSQHIVKELSSLISEVHSAFSIYNFIDDGSLYGYPSDAGT